MTRNRLSPTRPGYFALWTGSRYPGREIPVCVYRDEARARLCAGVMGCAMRPVTAEELRTYLAWRQSLEPDRPGADPPLSLYLQERAPIWPLSRVIAYLEANP